MKINEILENMSIELNEIGYWTLAIPSKFDEAILECIQEFNNLSPHDKLNQKKDITISVAWLLLSFSERMASLSLRTENQNTFDIGLIALNIIFGKLDFREIIIIFSLYYDVSVRHRYSFDKILGQKDEFSGILSSFLNRKFEDKQIETMGFTVEVNDLKKLTYKRTL